MNRPRYHMLLIALVGLIAYSNTFHASFHFDDTQNIVENPIIKDYSYFLEPSKAKGLRVYDLFRNRYIGYLTFALNYHLHGLDVAGYHVVNLAIHIINALLVYWFVLLTFRTPFLRDKDQGVNPQLVALFSALLFVSHPVQTQAVTYIVQRFASLATLFYLLSLVTYIKWRLNSFSPAAARLPVVWYIVSFLSAVLAMKTKEIAFTLPVVIMLYEFMFFGGPMKKRLLFLIPLLLTMLIIPLSMISLNKPIGDIIGEVNESTRALTNMSRWDYLFTQFRVIVTYLRLLVLPINQNLDYDYPVFHSFFDTEVLFSFSLLAMIFGLGVYLLYRSRHASPILRLIAFGVFWFFITLSVESSAIPIADIIFEHRLYLPSVGLLILISATVAVIFDKTKIKQLQFHKIVMPFFALVVIIFSIVAFSRNVIWRDEISLWKDTVNKSPRKARPYNELGLAYEKDGQLSAAVTNYLEVIKLDPYSVQPYINLAGVYCDINLDKAIEYYQIALGIRSDDANIQYNVGIAYYNKQLFNKAIEHFKIALKLKPDDPDIYNNLGMAFKAKGLFREAVEQYQLAIRLKPDHAPAHYNLGKIYLEDKLIDKSRNEIDLAIRIDPNDPAIRVLHDYLSHLGKNHQ